MLKKFCLELNKALAQHYFQHAPQAASIYQCLLKLNANILFDHFAFIEIPGTYTGIPLLSWLFSALGYQIEGQGYLSEKQNDFLWLAQTETKIALASEALPQIVIADFRYEEIPHEVLTIIKKYAAQTPPLIVENIEILAKQLANGEVAAWQPLWEIVLSRLTQRQWPLPTIGEYQKVYAANELLAWVLAWGNQINHYTIAVHHLHKHFSSLHAFNAWLIQNLSINLNWKKGEVKGNQQLGLEQSSTQSPPTQLTLADGEIHINEPFMEFIWRFPLVEKPLLWQDYFQGFIANQANYVIESVYKE